MANKLKTKHFLSFDEAQRRIQKAARFKSSSVSAFIWIAALEKMELDWSCRTNGLEGRVSKIEKNKNVLEIVVALGAIILAIEPLLKLFGIEPVGAIPRLLRYIPSWAT